MPVPTEPTPRLMSSKISQDEKEFKIKDEKVFKIKLKATEIMQAKK